MLSILLKSLVFIVSSIVFLFLFWRRLKDDYTRNQIFAAGLSSLLALYVGLGIGMILPKQILSPIFNLSGMWFWLGILLSTSAVLVCIHKFKMRAHEVVESYVLGLLSIGFAWSLIFLLPATAVFIMLAVIFFVVDKKYKNFSWYKSGKLGLAGLISLATFFIIRSVVAIVNPNMISFIGRVDALVSAVVAFGLFLAIYNLSEKV